MRPSWYGKMQPACRSLTSWICYGHVPDPSRSGGPPVSIPTRSAVLEMQDFPHFLSDGVDNPLLAITSGEKWEGTESVVEGMIFRQENSSAWRRPRCTTAKSAPDFDIPECMMKMGNNAANDFYTKRCKEEGIKIHPARFPALLPKFFIKLLTDPDDLILDPFAGSLTAGAVAEELERRWIAGEAVEEYLKAGIFRFEESNRNPSLF